MIKCWDDDDESYYYCCYYYYYYYYYYYHPPPLLLLVLPPPAHPRTVPPSLCLSLSLSLIGKPVYALSWGPDNDQVVVSTDKDLMIKSVNQAGKKAVQWKAHEGVVMTVDWNMVNQLIVSGGEDCTYKVRRGEVLLVVVVVVVVVVGNRLGWITLRFSQISCFPLLLLLFLLLGVGCLWPSVVHVTAL